MPTRWHTSRAGAALVLPVSRAADALEDLEGRLTAALDVRVGQRAGGSALPAQIASRRSWCSRQAIVGRGTRTAARSSGPARTPAHERVSSELRASSMITSWMSAFVAMIARSAAGQGVVGGVDRGDHGSATRGASAGGEAVP